VDAEPAVVDASAVLAYVQREPGWEVVAAALVAGATISAVNLAEVHGLLASRERNADAIVERLKALGLDVEPFGEADALASGRMYPHTRELGLSLGDRACVVLGQRLERRVLTTDRACASLEAGVRTEVIR
jgi:ribonuclease VapC